MVKVKAKWIDYDCSNSECDFPCYECKNKRLIERYYNGTVQAVDIENKLDALYVSIKVNNSEKFGIYEDACFNCRNIIKYLEVDGEVINIQKTKGEIANERHIRYES